MSLADKELNDIAAAIRSYIELEVEAGMAEYYQGSRLPGPHGTDAGAGKAQSSKHDLTKGDDDLTSLRREILACKNCDLHRTRRNVVFGSGNPKATLVFIGEAPGQEEDAQGLPFVGRAGQLLTKIIEAMGLKREDVYIANNLKCRPPNNRAPLPTEILACEENVKRQIELIGPKVICTLGKFASQTLLRTQTPISALRGKFQDYHGIKVMPTFHPAYLLRNPADKRLVWEDMKKVKKVLQE